MILKEQQLIHSKKRINSGSFIIRKLTNNFTFSLFAKRAYTACYNSSTKARKFVFVEDRKEK